MGFSLLFNNILLGIGLAMDAFSVSLANGLNEPEMHKRRMCKIAGVYGFFQALMPLTGWICVHTIVQYFQAFEKLIPWIALILLSYIGGKMLWEGLHTHNDEVCPNTRLTFQDLIIQGIATSIDALSVGFTIANYDFASAFLSAMIIAVTTFIICMIGLYIGKKAGTKLSGKAGILGGLILIFIGVEIFISNFI